MILMKKLKVLIVIFPLILVGCTTKLQEIQLIQTPSLIKVNESLLINPPNLISMPVNDKNYSDINDIRKMLEVMAENYHQYNLNKIQTESLIEIIKNHNAIIEKKK